MRAARAAGHSWGKALGAGIWHNWLASYWRWREYRLTRKWDRTPFNQLYQQLLLHPERRAELTSQMVELLPREWQETLEQVALKRAHPSSESSLLSRFPGDENLSGRGAPAPPLWAEKRAEVRA